MVEERRNDVGSKITTSVYTGVITIILGLFINATWSTAKEGVELGNKAIVEITDVKSKYQAIHDDLIEIKDLLKRKIPQ